MKRKGHRPTQRERSAGAVVYANDSVGRLYLLLRYGAGHWGFPKGHVEGRESDMEAAIREIEEETGLALADLRFVDGFRDATRYSFQRGRLRIDKEVVFFLAEALKRDVKLSDEHTDFAWLSYPAALERVSFEGPRRILEAAETFSKNREAASHSTV